MKRLAAAITVMAIALPLPAQMRELKPGFNLFSKEQDVQLGREAAQQVEKQMPVVRDGQIVEYVQRIGQRLAAQPQADKYPYTFSVVNDRSINAFALPGGPTFVHTGLLAAADNEAQVAGVLAHEIAHVALRHGTNQASKANLIQLPAMLAGAMVGGSGSILGQLSQLGIGLGANSVLLKFSRNAERDADLLGARMMAAAGYNPIEMARFFEKLEAQGGRQGAVAQFLSDHPNPGNRVKAVTEEIRYLPRREYGTQVGDLERVQSLVKQLPAPPAQKKIQQGAAGAADPRPSGRMTQYQGSAYSIAYPDNWEVFGDRGAAMVTIAPRAGLVDSGRGGTAIGYGTMVSFYFPQGDRIDLRQHTEDLIRQLQSSNPGLKVQGRSRNVRVDGQAGLATTMSSPSPFQGNNEVDMLVTVARPEGLFYVLFIAPESEYRQAQGVFEEMLRSIRFAK